MITPIKFRTYLQCQYSGTTNMFIVINVMAITGLSRDECIDIMENYDKYAKEFGTEEV